VLGGHLGSFALAFDGIGIATLAGRRRGQRNIQLVDREAAGLTAAHIQTADVDVGRIFVQRQQVTRGVAGRLRGATSGVEFGVAFSPIGQRRLDLDLQRVRGGESGDDALITDFLFEILQPADVQLDLAHQFLGGRASGRRGGQPILLAQRRRPRRIHGLVDQKGQDFFAVVPRPLALQPGDALATVLSPALLIGHPAETMRDDHHQHVGLVHSGQALGQRRIAAGREVFHHPGMEIAPQRRLAGRLAMEPQILTGRRDEHDRQIHSRTPRWIDYRHTPDKTGTGTSRSTFVPL